MRTTINVSSPLLSALKQHCRKNGMSIKAGIEAAISAFLTAKDSHKGKEKFKLKDASVKGQGMCPDFAAEPWEKIRDEIYSLK